MVKQAYFYDAGPAWAPGNGFPGSTGATVFPGAAGDPGASGSGTTGATGALVQLGLSDLQGQWNPPNLLVLWVGAPELQEQLVQLALLVQWVLPNWSDRTC